MMKKLIKVYLANRREIKRLLMLSLLLIIFDQTTKIIAQKYLENSTPIIVVPDLLSFYYVRNHISHIHQYIIYFVLVIILFPTIILQSISKSSSKTIIVGLTLLWSAVFSNNIIDAFLLGYIRDFINLHGIAVGNVADQYRNLGMLALVAGLIIKDEKKLTSKTLLKLALVLIMVLILTALFWRYLSKSMAI